ncbi:MAG: hypothetical protein A2664_04605 [Candidatus Taylorbacteria bacterium RIFCSPHIGHO2_01_FULL_46_22b]|uniref:Fumarate lyase N-terminal domain-containing protein n=1 Tax=Candidatus Taylorbacteria bacterium RIFCSPHIGHO2_01_FULL_46_22b TaxID=1802301 RepID=A0A1G2M6L0_9BACT|nr:MAG: hypothetical protein A2664_04605 [Candidatus Taylorbacteria bacterium RIFCSPHIGHO2_01_FULL_46_22b]
MENSSNKFAVYQTAITNEKGKSMIPRYTKPKLTLVFSTFYKYNRWQQVELAVLEARADVGEISRDDCETICRILRDTPIDELWIDGEEKNSRHDYNAFLAERRRHLPKHLQRLFHGDMTSYDGEEPATSLIMKEALGIVISQAEDLEAAVVRQIRKHRFTPRLERTHNRGAEIQSVGRFFITLLTPLAQARKEVVFARNAFDQTKLTGAVGSGSGPRPAVRAKALMKLGLTEFDGATQIMPRTIHSKAASALADLASWLEKMALDLWLGSRDPFPVYEEPFGKGQKGSSAMPWKKNPITLEKVRGLARWARACAEAIRANIVSPEGRDISQSSVERIAWPDLCHTLYHMLGEMIRVVNGLNVYADNLAREIANMRGLYAGSVAKELLAEWLKDRFDAEEVYRMVQLAGMNITEPKGVAAKYRACNAPKSPDEADKWTETMCLTVWNPPPEDKPDTLELIIPTGGLRPSPILDIAPETISEWNKALRTLVTDNEKMQRWSEIFKPSHWFRHEEDQYQRVLGEYPA